MRRCDWTAARALTGACLASMAMATMPLHAQTADIPAAEALLKASKCSKCHSVDKKKDGPSFQETAKKLKGKPDAEARLIKHLTTNPKVKIDGIEEEHPAVKSKNDAEIRNLVNYILSR